MTDDVVVGHCWRNVKSGFHVWHLTDVKARSSVSKWSREGGACLCVKRGLKSVGVSLSMKVDKACNNYAAHVSVSVGCGGARTMLSRFAQESLQDDDRCAVLVRVVGVQVEQTQSAACDVLVFAFCAASSLPASAGVWGDVLSGHSKSGLLADCTVKLHDGEVEAHRIVLANLSPYMRSLFALRGKLGDEADSWPVIDLSQYSKAAFSALLSCAFGSVPALSEVTLEMANLADFLMSPGLKSFCDHALALTLSVENVAERAIAADAIVSPRLREAAATYVGLFFRRVWHEHRDLMVAHPALFLDMAGDRLAAHPDLQKRRGPPARLPDAAARQCRS